MARPKTRNCAPKQIKSRPKRHLFRYPLFLFLVLCGGVFLVASTLGVGADNIFVTAKVSGPLVTSPAVITSPSNGTRFSSIPITVSGTCPTNASYVEIFRNNLMSGTAICDLAGNFQLSADLFPGQNDLVAHVFNLTDDEGPVSGTVTVYYDVPVPPVSSPKQGVPSATPLMLQTAFKYKGYYTGQEVQWPLEISGGTPSYALSVDWGDGSSNVISRSSAGQFNITHTYASPGGYKNSYTIKVNASDANGGKAFIQFFVIVNTKVNVGAGGNIFSKSPPTLGGRGWLWFAWPAYLLVIILVLSYWLGEREELIILKKRGLLRR